MDWMALSIGIGGGVVAALITQGGGWLGTAAAHRREERVGERPIIQQIADVFLDVQRLAITWPYNSSQRKTDAELAFSKWWDEHRLVLDRLVLEVRDTELRGQFKELSEALGIADQAYNYGFSSQKYMVKQTAEVGAELAGASLRRQKPDAGTLKTLAKIKRAAKDQMEFWQEQWELQDEYEQGQSKKSHRGDPSAD